MQDRSKSVGVLQGVAIYMGSVLGGGILILPSLAAGAAGPASLIAWVLVTVFSLPVAMVFGFLSVAIPTNGGVSDFARAGFNAHVGNVAGWMYFFLLPCGQPSVMLSGVFYLEYVLHLSRAQTISAAFAIVSVAAVIALSGKKLTAWAQVAIMAAILAIVSVTLLLGLTRFDAGHFQPFVPQGLPSIGTALSLVIWSYIGVENLSFVAEDFKDPRRDMLNTILIGTAVVGFIYIASSVVAIGVIPPADWSTTRAPFAYVAEIAAGRSMATAIATIGLFIVGASAIAFVWGGSNLCAALAKQGALPSVLAGRPGQPQRAAIVFLWSLYAAMFAAIYAFDMDITGLAKMVGAATLTTYAISAFAALRILDRGRWSAVLTILGSFAILPFFGWALLFPLAIAAVYAGYAATRNLSKAERSGQAI